MPKVVRASSSLIALERESADFRLYRAYTMFLSRDEKLVCEEDQNFAKKEEPGSSYLWNQRAR
ncbi:hypothetical protein J3R74_003784 [Puniceicoccus vermicola]